MAPDIIVTGIIVTLTILTGLYALYKKRQRDNAWKSFPAWWTMKGEAPPMTGVALDIIKQNTPGMKYYGSIEWVKGPFMDGLSSQLLAGLVQSFYPPTIKLMYFEKVEQSALAHEIGHVWRAQTDRAGTEPAADPEFAKWLADVNAQIAKAVGR